MDFLDTPPELGRKLLVTTHRMMMRMRVEGGWCLSAGHGGSGGGAGGGPGLRGRGPGGRPSRRRGGVWRENYVGEDAGFVHNLLHHMTGRYLHRHRGRGAVVGDHADGGRACRGRGKKREGGFRSIWQRSWRSDKNTVAIFFHDSGIGSFTSHIHTHKWNSKMFICRIRKRLEIRMIYGIQ